MAHRPGRATDETTNGSARGPLVAFLGPSLSAAAATAVVPDVHLLAPVCQGDLSTVVEARRPRGILIVDGEFGQSLSVWHKEILAAIRAGIRVVGASSMGALRAAELDRYGMEGVGEIYAYYRDGWLTDDADVALLHGDADSGYRALTWPIVNVRSTVAALERGGVIDAAHAKATLVAAGQLHFSERTASAVEKQLRADGLGAAAARDVVAAIVAGFVDQKAADAVAGFEHLARLDAIPPPTAETPLHIDVHTFSALLSSDTAIERDGVSLRRYQLVNDVALHEPEFEQVVHRALERRLLTSLAGDFGVRIDPAEHEDQRRRLLVRLGLTVDTLDAWLVDNDLDLAAFEALVGQEAIVARFRRWTADMETFDRGRRGLIEQLQLEGRYVSAVTAAINRRRVLGTTATTPFPATNEDATSLSVRHIARTGWKPRPDLVTWAEENCFDSAATLLVALADAEAVATAKQDRRARVARVFGIGTANGAGGTDAASTGSVANGDRAGRGELRMGDGVRMHAMLEAHQTTQILLAAVELGVPAALAPGPQSLSELAAATASAPARLERFLRALRAIGVVDAGELGAWSLTALGRTLVAAGGSDHGDNGATHSTGEFGLDSYAGHLRAEVLTTWASLADVIRGADPPAYPSDEMSDRAIAAAAEALDLPAAVVSLIGVPVGGRVLDVGGGLGLTAEALHEARPDLSVAILELSGTAERAAARLARRGLGSAIEVLAYTDQPVEPPVDCCLLVRVLASIDDEAAVGLLGNLRRSLAPGGRVDVIDTGFDAGPPSAFGDLLNLCRSGGVVRNTHQWNELATRSGLRLVDTAPIQAPMTHLCFVAADDDDTGAAGERLERTVTAGHP